MVATKLSEVASKGWRASGSGSVGASTSNSTGSLVGAGASSDPSPSTPSRPSLATAAAAVTGLTAAVTSVVATASSDIAAAAATTTPAATAATAASGAGTNTSPLSLTSPSAIWDAASSSLDQAYSSVSKTANYYIGWDSFGGSESNHSNHNNNMPGRNQKNDNASDMPSSMSPSWLQSIVFPPRDNDNNNTNVNANLPFSSPWRQLHNPYNRVRGRYAENHQNSSLKAVRSLLPLVVNDNNAQNVYNHKNTHRRYNSYPVIAEVSESQEDNPLLDDATTEGEASLQFLTADSEDSKTSRSRAAARRRTESEDSFGAQKSRQGTLGGLLSRMRRRGSNCPYTPDSFSALDPYYDNTNTTSVGGGDAATFYTPPPNSSNTRQQNNQDHQNMDTATPTWHQNSETASQLAEGTVRAFRDIALDEAVEFHAALRFWSDRWEHPLLSWLEAGPMGTYLMGEIYCVLHSLIVRIQNYKKLGIQHPSLLEI